MQLSHHLPSLKKKINLNPLRPRDPFGPNHRLYSTVPLPTASKWNETLVLFGIEQIRLWAILCFLLLYGLRTSWELFPPLPVMHQTYSLVVNMTVLSQNQSENRTRCSQRCDHGNTLVIEYRDFMPSHLGSCLWSRMLRKSVIWSPTGFCGEGESECPVICFLKLCFQSFLYLLISLHKPPVCMYFFFQFKLYYFECQITAISMSCME